MSTGALVLSLAYAAMFGFAGVEKLRRPKLAALALVDFRLTARPRISLGRAAGSVEVAAAALLAVPQTARFGASVAALLLLAFAGLLARAARNGESFACFCFGDTSGDVSWLFAARAAVLGAAAAILAWWLLTQSPSVSGREFLEAAVAGTAGFTSALLASKLPSLRRYNRNFMRPGGAHS